MTMTDPFAGLKGFVKDQIDRNLMSQWKAERRLKRLIGTYREMLEDTRYAIVREELRATLGYQLKRLVEKAQDCSHCAPMAERVTLLQQIVNEPVEAVWYEENRPKNPEVEAEELDLS